MTVFLTILSGVLVYVLGQLLLKLVIEPVQEMRRAIGRTAHTLHLRAPFASSPGLQDPERIQAASEEIRRLSADLRESLVVIPAYRQLARFFGLPERESVLKAATNLVGLSNGLGSSNEGGGPENRARTEMICKVLGIEVPPGE